MYKFLKPVAVFFALVCIAWQPIEAAVRKLAVTVNMDGTFSDGLVEQNLNGAYDLVLHTTSPVGSTNPYNPPGTIQRQKIALPNRYREHFYYLTEKKGASIVQMYAERGSYFFRYDVFTLEKIVIIGSLKNSPTIDVVKVNILQLNEGSLLKYHGIKIADFDLSFIHPREFRKGETLTFESVSTSSGNASWTASLNFELKTKDSSLPNDDREHSSFWRGAMLGVCKRVVQHLLGTAKSLPIEDLRAK